MVTILYHWFSHGKSYSRKPNSGDVVYVSFKWNIFLTISQPWCLFSPKKSYYVAAKECLWILDAVSQ